MEGRGLTRHIRVYTVFGWRPQTGSEERECHGRNVLNQCLKSVYAQWRPLVPRFGAGSATAVVLLFASLSTLVEFGILACKRRVGNPASAGLDLSFHLRESADGLQNVL